MLTMFTLSSTLSIYYLKLMFYHLKTGAVLVKLLPLFNKQQHYIQPNCVKNDSLLRNA